MPSAKTLAAWVDKADGPAQEELPAFLKQSHTTPAWAVSDDKRREHSSTNSTGEITATKRFRSEDLDALLSRTEPLLSSKHDLEHASVPTILSVLPLPRDSARTVQWHPNGQLAVVGGNHHIYTFHAAGKFVEQLSKVDVERRVEQAALTATGEDIIVVGHQSYIPVLLSLSTEKMIELRFLDTRDCAIHRNGRRDNSKKDFYLTKVVPKLTDGMPGVVAAASGCTVKLGSLTSGSVIGSMALDANVSDICFTSPNELTVAAGNKLTVYDIRRTPRYLHQIVDHGSLHVTSFATSRTSLAIGSASGVVNVYDRGNTNIPIKVLKNLTTPIHTVRLGENSRGEAILSFSTKGQKAGFRLVRLPECRVMPSFPAVSTRHEFIQCLSIAPTVPVLSVGEKQKVTNYAL